MKCYANLEKLSIELQEKSSNLEQHLYGVDPGRSIRWNEIVFLLELCHYALSASASDANNSVLSRKAIPDTQRIKEIETLVGSLLVDELFLDKPDAFESIYALRPPTPGVTPSSSSFRRDIFQKLSLMLGRNSTEMEYLNSFAESWGNGEIVDNAISSRKFLALSSRFYLLYLALGESTDLKRTIESFRQQKLPEWTSLSPAEDATKQDPLLRPTSEDTFSICECFN